MDLEPLHTDSEESSLSKGFGKLVENFSDYSDYQIWQNFKAGDEKAFAYIYETHVNLLYNYGCNLIVDRFIVKDGIQDLFIELWNTKNKLGDVKSIKGYLYKSLRRSLLKKLRKERKNQSIHWSSVELKSPSSEHRLIEKQQFDIDRKKLQKVLNRLNAKQREIVHLKFYANLSYEDIGNIMGLDKKGAYNLMAYTIKLLRDYLTLFLLIIL